MPTLSGIYDSAAIQPVARFKDNLSILSLGKWAHYRINYVEPIPPGPASTVEMVTATLNTAIAAGATIAKSIVAILQLNDMELAHLRWEPLDNVEGVLWELSGQARFNTRNIHARVDIQTKLRDPYLVTTTFFVMGLQRDMNLEVRNPMAYPTSVARFRFWGFRYLLSPLRFKGITPADEEALSNGDPDVVKRYLGATTWLPAEGKQS